MILQLSIRSRFFSVGNIYLNNSRILRSSRRTKYASCTVYMYSEGRCRACKVAGRRCEILLKCCLGVMGSGTMGRLGLRGVKGKSGARS